jgi:membrane protein DedA with SNARE-associated domain
VSKSRQAIEMTANVHSVAALVATIVFGSLISEDAATLTAAALAAAGALDANVAFASAVAGIVAGDVALFGIARRARGSVEHSRLYRRVARAKIAVAETWFSRWGEAVLIATRFMPGTRLPATLAAGVLAIPGLRFAVVSTIGAVIWTSLNFLVVSKGARSIGIGPFVLVLAALSLFVWVFKANFGKRIGESLTRLKKWEFWPAWIFYIPVLGMSAWLAFRYRGVSLPALANPSQRNGGLIGESKSEILQALEEAAPEFMAPSRLIVPGNKAQRMRQLLDAIADGIVRLPFVLKPDVGQRGAGVRIISTIADAESYLAQVSGPVIAQRYAPGPHEAGVFYYRFPGEESGKILAITEKRFPKIVGDGVHSIRELILADTRAQLISAVYLRRFGDHSSRVPDNGEVVSLVECGNHCQGCIFLDGWHLFSEALRESLDRISRAVPGFYVGRYDLRYENPEELRQGRGFAIVELNGAASEATSIYDPQQSLLAAYRLLYRQWQIVYAIGAENRRRGHKAPSIFDLLRDWNSYRQQSVAYPIAS